MQQKLVIEMFDQLAQILLQHSVVEIFLFQKEWGEHQVIYH